MPYKSLKQERYFNANKAKLEAKGVNVDEWNAASKGKKFQGKGTRARLNTAAEKHFYGSKYSK